MCHATFLAASRPAPLVDLRQDVWLGIKTLDARHTAVATHFPADWFVYYVASHSGCSCGFHSTDVLSDDEPYNDQSRRALAAYLSRLLLDTDVHIALYNCWEGDEGLEVQHHARASPDQLAQLPDPVPERTLVAVVRP